MSNSVGRYEIHQEIAAGGMARVHFGRLRGDEGFKRLVAIKRMHPKLARDPKFVAMFRDEALLASRIRHPNVVPTLDVVSTGDDVVIVMEYVRGLPLSVLLARAGRRKEDVPVPIAIAILCGMLAGLHAAHEARGPDGAPLSIVHRDVSPQNILVDVDGVTRVMDFGIAKASSQLHITMEGEIKGKLGYMAPEQILGKAIDRRVDVFAAGVVAYSMLTGNPLFSGGEVDEIRERVLSMPIPPLTARRPDADEALWLALAKALERDRGARYSSAREFETAVEASFARPATARQLGAWVEQLGADVLADRERSIAAIEAEAPPSESSEGALEITSTDAPTIDLLEVPSAPASLASPDGGDPTVVERAEGERTSSSVVSDLTRAPSRRVSPLAILAGAAGLASVAAVAVWVTRSAPEPRPTEAHSQPGAIASADNTGAVERAPIERAPIVEAPSASGPPAAAVSSQEPSVSSSVSARPGTHRKAPGYFPNRP